MREEKVRNLYSTIFYIEKDLHEITDQEFDSEQDMIRYVTAVGKMLKYI